MTTTTEPGRLDVLSVGHGHLPVTIDPGDPESVEKARTLITDMLRRGASIFVETDNGETRRVKKFDATRMKYLIDESDAVAVLTGKAIDDPAPPRPRTRKRAVDATRAKATAVGRTAGG